MKEIKEFIEELEHNQKINIEKDLENRVDIDYVIERLKNIVEDFENNDKRICSECKKEMSEGYCIENGEEYYCCDECLHKHYSENEYLEMYDCGNGDSYWTQWED